MKTKRVPASFTSAQSMSLCHFERSMPWMGKVCALRDARMGLGVALLRIVVRHDRAARQQQERDPDQDGGETRGGGGFKRVCAGMAPETEGG